MRNGRGSQIADAVTLLSWIGSRCAEFTVIDVHEAMPHFHIRTCYRWVTAFEASGLIELVGFRAVEREDGFGGTPRRVYRSRVRVRTERAEIRKVS